jgi:hypothetical protein
VNFSDKLFKLSNLFTLEISRWVELVFDLEKLKLRVKNQV